ncbi:hypothetical protein HMPREF3198_00410 [Winkia neuii]|nr:hypothetical protein HMPREF3198_00410 [Winkia neuii]
MFAAQMVGYTRRPATDARRPGSGLRRKAWAFSLPALFRT